MSGYQLFVGILIFIILVPLWILMSNTTNTTLDVFNSVSPSFSNEYTIGSNVMYAYLFIISIVLLLWVYKSGVEEKKQGGAYYQ